MKKFNEKRNEKSKQTASKKVDSAKNSIVSCFGLKKYFI